MSRKLIVAAVLVAVWGWSGAAVAVQDGIQQPQNCTNPCATRVHYTYSLGNKSATAEWYIIDVTKNNQFIKAQAFCRTGGSPVTYQWQTATSWASQNTPSSTKVCAAPYNAGISDNGYIWTQ